MSSPISHRCKLSNIIILCFGFLFLTSVLKELHIFLIRLVIGLNSNWSSSGRFTNNGPQIDVACPLFTHGSLWYFNLSLTRLTKIFYLSLSLSSSSLKKGKISEMSIDGNSSSRLMESLVAFTKNFGGIFFYIRILLLIYVVTVSDWGVIVFNYSYRLGHLNRYRFLWIQSISVLAWKRLAWNSFQNHQQ